MLAQPLHEHAFSVLHPFWARWGCASSRQAWKQRCDMHWPILRSLCNTHSTRRNSMHAYLPACCMGGLVPCSSSILLPPGTTSHVSKLRHGLVDSCTGNAVKNLLVGIAFATCFSHLDF
jgi:hypothetical protein